MAEKLTKDELIRLIGQTVQESLPEAVKALGLDKTDEPPIHTSPEHLLAGAGMGKWGSDYYPDVSLAPRQRQVIFDFFRGLLAGPGTEERDRYWRDLSVGTGTSGGNLVPTELQAAIVEDLRKAPVIRNIATVIPITAKTDLPALGTRPSATWPGENTITTAVSGSNLLGNNVQLRPNEMALLLYTSKKLVRNANVGIADFIVRLFSQAVKEEEDRVFAMGTGSGQPQGIYSASITAVSTVSGNLTADHLIDIFYAVPSQYRVKGTWLMTNKAQQAARKLKDSNSRYQWTDGLGAAPSTLMGRPVLEQNDLPDNLGSGSDTQIFYGDFSFYYIGDEMTLEAEVSTEARFQYRQLAIQVVESIDGKTALTNAFRKGQATV